MLIPHCCDISGPHSGVMKDQDTSILGCYTAFNGSQHAHLQDQNCLTIPKDESIMTLQNRKHA